MTNTAGLLLEGANGNSPYCDEHKVMTFKMAGANIPLKSRLLRNI